MAKRYGKLSREQMDDLAEIKNKMIGIHLNSVEKKFASLVTLTVQLLHNIQTYRCRPVHVAIEQVFTMGFTLLILQYG